MELNKFFIYFKGLHEISFVVALRSDPSGSRLFTEIYYRFPVVE